MPLIKDRHFLVTGGSGYLGAEFIETLLSNGAFVTSLASLKMPINHPRLHSIQWRLEGGTKELSKLIMNQNFPAPEALFHLAHSWKNLVNDNGEQINLVGSIALYEWAKNNKIRFVFASSVSSREGALNHYGKIKYQAEQLMEFPIAVVARIGLVYGGKQTSQWGLLCKLVGKTRLLPMVDPWVRVQPIHISEVVNGLITIGVGENISRKVYVLASNKDMAFGEFLCKISEQLYSRKLVVVPVSGGAILLLLNLIPNCLLNTAAIKDRVLGLMGIKKIDNREDLIELDLNISDVTLESNKKTPSLEIRREAHLLMGSILKKSPSTDSIDRYQKAIELFHYNKPYKFPFWVANSSLARLIEPLPWGIESNANATELLARFNLALAILESGEGASLIYNYKSNKSNRLSCLKVCLIEAIAFPFRWLYWKIW